MSPPSLTETARPGGTTTGRQALTGEQLAMMLRAAHKALIDCGVVMPPAKVARIVRGFGRSAARNGVTFHEFLSNAANLSPQQRRSIIANPELARAIAYADPTGESAVNNVMREVGRG